MVTNLKCLIIFALDCSCNQSFLNPHILRNIKRLLFVSNLKRYIHIISSQLVYVMLGYN